jgi:hypothetical protein
MERKNVTDHAEQYRKRLEKRRSEQNNGMTINAEIHHKGPEDRKDSWLDGWRWVENASKGLRVVGPVHDYRNTNPHGDQPYVDRSIVNHTGWFTDSVFQDETVYGVILQLPARKGKPMYVPAVSDPNNEDAYLANFRNWSEDIIECIRAADGMAETYAENEREYRTLESARQRIEDIREELTQMRAERRNLIRELRANCSKLAGMPQLKAALKAHIRAVKADAEKLHKEVEKLTDDPWSIAY